MAEKWNYAGLRAPPLPVEHLQAELLAAPFVLEAAFESALVYLDPTLGSKPAFGSGALPGTVRLWRETERNILSRFPGMSIDELVLRRDRLWFDSPSIGRMPKVPLNEVLERAAGRLVSVGSGVAHPMVEPHRREAQQRRTWRWLTFSLPADLLLAAAGARCDHLDQVSPLLAARLADDGLAEPHLHLKAAIPFPSLWSSLMRALGGREANAGLAPLLLTAALARLLLAGFLGEPTFRRQGFSAFLDDHAGRNLVRRYGAGACQALWRSVFSLAGGEKPGAASFAILQDLYSRWIGQCPKVGIVGELDPMSGWYPASEVTHPDFNFTLDSLTYIRGRRESPDILFETLFWQIVRSRALFYRHVVQRPMVPGLQWFTRAYARLSSARGPVKTGMFIPMAKELAGAGLRSLEVRIVPDESVSDLRKSISGIAKASLPSRDSSPSTSGRRMAASPEVGIVFHFSRVRGEAALEGRPAAWSRSSHDDPGDTKANTSGYRYSGYYKGQRGRATALASVLVSYPRTLELVRGIDLCTDELAVPLWVLAPLVHHVVRAGEEASAYLLRTENRRVPPLRLTVHGGEDYVHLLGGIRRVDEAIDLLGLREGSRVGHAVALGVDVRDWAQRTRQLVLPKGERLLDLLWARRVVLREPQQFASWLQWIDGELVPLGSELFGRPLLPHELEEWWTALHDQNYLRAARFPDGPSRRFSDLSDSSSPQRRSLAMVSRWLTDRSLIRRSQELLDIELEREVPLTAAVQAHVRGRLSSYGIVVEINPSSNLLIGHLGDLTSHPLWRLCPPAIPRTEAPDAPAVRVCIGSDDPITFATSLPEEYQLLADALTEAGVAAPAVDAWLDAAREAGLKSRFTVPRSGEDLMTPMRPRSSPTLY